ncbi:hypothetical protein MKX03_027613 [Papaver bracteatum]|nr:hypothetical protein MKX03_027613 [Papaver bracteatum]
MMGMSKKKKTAKNWFTSVKNAFKSSSPISSSSPSKDYSLANKIIEEEHEIPEIVSLEHYPICDTSSLTTTIDENAEAVLEMRDEDRRRSNHAIAMAVVAAEAAVLAAHEATKVSRFSSYNRRRFYGYSKEERAATKIQSHYKGYLARRALRALRGLVKLQALVRGHNVRKQAEMTMRCMQAIVRVQARTKADRLRLQGATSHDNEKNKGKKRATETWDNSRGRQRNSFSYEKEYARSSTEKINKQEHYLSSNSMTIKNERALAYAYPYQDSVSNRQNSVDSYSDEKTHQGGGWNLLDRWIDSQPWHRDKHVAAIPESSYTSRTYNTDDDNASERTADTDLVSLSPSYQLRFNPIANLAKLGLNSDGSVKIRQRKQRVMVSVETENVNTPSYMATTQSAKAKAKSAQNSLLSSSSSTKRIFLNDLSMSSSTDGIGIGTGTEVRTMNQLGPINSPSPTSSQKMMRLLKMGKPIKAVR